MYREGWKKTRFSDEPSSNKSYTELRHDTTNFYTQHQKLWHTAKVKSVLYGAITYVKTTKNPIKIGLVATGK